MRFIIFKCGMPPNWGKNVFRLISELKMWWPNHYKSKTTERFQTQ